MDHEVKELVTSVLLTQKLKDAATKASQAVFSGRGLSSLWVEQAIEEFVLEPGWIGLVGYGEDHETDKKVKLVLRLTPIAQEKLRWALIEVRLIEPTLEGVRSQLIRSAIRRAIDRKLKFKLKQVTLPPKEEKPIRITELPKLRKTKRTEG